MEEQIPAGVDYNIKLNESKHIIALDTGRKVCWGARFIISALSGELESKGTHSVRHEPISQFDVLPRLEWHDKELDPEIQAIFPKTGTVGEYYTDKTTDLKPSEVFDSGFYAGVLAAREGLVNPDKFHRTVNEDLKHPVEPEIDREY